ncbi:MAG: orotate phosphoribosyltransferase [Gemmatimonadota bacterium]
MRLLELLIERSLSLGTFTLASGATSSYYIDARRTTMSAEGQALVGRVALETIRSAGIDVEWIGGLTMGADPISYAIAHRSWVEDHPLNAFSVRKEVKEYGTTRQIEGGLPSGARVLVVEDAITSGGSALRAIDAVRSHGAHVLGLLALVDREEGGRQVIEDLGIPVTRLFTASELLLAAGEDPSS